MTNTFFRALAMMRYMLIPLFYHRVVVSQWAIQQCCHYIENNKNDPFYFTR